MLDADGRGSYPVELVEEPTPAAARRPHRWITAPSGFVLFACLFLPAVENCGQVTYAFELWPVATPYLLGLVVGILAFVRAPRVRAGLVLAARILVWFTIGGWGLYLAAIAVSEGEVVPVLVWVPLGVILGWMFGLDRHGEGAAARVAVATAVMSAVWFGLLSFEPGSLVGVYVAAAAAVGLLVGGLEWRRELGPPARWASLAHEA